MDNSTNEKVNEPTSSKANKEQKIELTNKFDTDEDFDEYDSDFEAEEKLNTKKSKEKASKEPTLLDHAIKDIQKNLDNLRHWQDLISKDGVSLLNTLITLDGMDAKQTIEHKKDINNQIVNFESIARAMLESCSDFLHSTEAQAEVWSNLLQQQRQEREGLQNVVEQLAEHQHKLSVEAAENQGIPLPTTPKVQFFSEGEDDRNDEFFDAGEIIWSKLILKAKMRDPNESRYILRLQRRYGSAAETKSLEVKEDATLPQFTPIERVEFRRESTASMAKLSPKERRTRIPDKPHLPLNLWAFLKNCIGKDLAHVPMPVNFNEPLSLLQRLTENFEYSHLLDIAADCASEIEQLAYVAAFSVSNYSSTADRIAKPFNPLLGETYECDRTADLGWRCIAEQVSHHPPISALFCEGEKWVCYMEFAMHSRFRIKHLEVQPSGRTFVEFKATGHKYMWPRVTTMIYNIVVGRIWVDQQGEAAVTGLKAAEGLKCVLEYVPYSYFSKTQQRCVKGVMFDRDGSVPHLLRGSWDRQISISRSADCAFTTGFYETIWTRAKPPPNSDKYYNFMAFTCQLNEMEDDVAPTDARRRPDQRLMEQGLWDQSAVEKSRLEAKQRARRHKLEQSMRRLEEIKSQAELQSEPASAKESQVKIETASSGYQPVWFSSRIEESTGITMFLYNGTYWEAKRKQDWSMCSDIF